MQRWNAHWPPDWVSSTFLFRSPFAIIAAKDNAAIKHAGVREGGVLPLESASCHPLHRRFDVTLYR
jgi:hypothetical protein